MKLDKRIIIAGFLICFAVAVFVLGYINATTQIKEEKDDPINVFLLPENATEIKIHGNGWITFHLGDKKILYFRHPFDHKIAVTSLP